MIIIEVCEESRKISAKSKTSGRYGSVSKMHIKCLPKHGQKVLSSLKGIILKNHFILAGGTALALQLGHRISVDLDFYSKRVFHRINSSGSAEPQA